MPKQRSHTHCSMVSIETSIITNEALSAWSSGLGHRAVLIWPLRSWNPTWSTSATCRRPQPLRGKHRDERHSGLASN